MTLALAIAKQHCFPMSNYDSQLTEGVAHARCEEVIAQYVDLFNKTALQSPLNSISPDKSPRRSYWSPYYVSRHALERLPKKLRVEVVGSAIVNAGARTPSLHAARLPYAVDLVFSGSVARGVEAIIYDGVGWTPEGVRSNESISTINDLYVFCDDTLPECWKHLLPLKRAGVEVIGNIEPFKTLLDESLRILRESEYFEWVSTSVRWLVPVSSVESKLKSGSTEAAPGLVYATAYSGVDLAEALVHEASHQHIYQLMCVAPLYDVRDGWQGWSPFVRRNRTPDGLILAAHAITNVAHFYTRLLIKGICSTECVAALQKWHEPLCQCLRVLGECPSLTEVGKFVSEQVERSYRELVLTHAHFGDA